MIDFEWDEEKRASNRAKHGLDFAEVDRFDWGGCYYLEDDVLDGEVRFRAVGFIDDRLVTVVGVERGDIVRIVSLRKATKGERDDY